MKKTLLLLFLAPFLAKADLLENFAAIHLNQRLKVANSCIHDGYSTRILDGQAFEVNSDQRFKPEDHSCDLKVDSFRQHRLHAQKRTHQLEPFNGVFFVEAGHYTVYGAQRVDDHFKFWVQMISIEGVDSLLPVLFTCRGKKNEPFTLEDLRAALGHLITPFALIEIK